MADRLELNGWVRNKLDQSVEALFSGLPETVDEMIRLCKEGPKDARVDTVEIVQKENIVLEDFRILDTE